MKVYILAFTALLLGLGALVTGIWLLAGTGWALIASSVVPILSGIALLRGMLRPQVPSEVEK